MKTVDLIVPCYNEGEMIDIFYDTTSAIVSEISGYTFNFIFIDDGSRDDTLKKVKNLASKHSNVKYIAFSRNFGKEAGMYAGLKASTGDRVAVIDADLQHPPELIKDMLYAIDEEGYDSCSARRVSREGEPKIRSAFSRLFYKLINKMSEVEIIDGAVDFRMMTRQMVDAILDLPEVQRFSKGIFCWVGFNTKWIEFKNVERVAGETSWSFWGLFRYAIDGITAFTTFPLRIATIVGSVVSASAFIYLIVELIKTLVWGSAVGGYPSTIIILLFIGGIIIMSLGIIGEYLARLYMETKNRPIFVFKDSNIEGLKNGRNK
ncbi:MAG: glycosyltransferase family 2 protein [Acutalibacteraceae bacterium]|nr:glycosyltransferase family 2 protein [Acutalibacteraceae bacterium]